MGRHDHDRGLQHDLRALRRQLDRRSALRLFAGAAFVPLLGCSASLESSSTGSSGSTAEDDTASNDIDASTCSVAPNETEGPYPGDDSNGKNILQTSGVVRSDIRSSIGGLSGTAQGVPVSLTMKLVSTKSACSALAGYVVYLWQCDQNGQYSMYSITDQNYLRGVQEADDRGLVTFTTIFPACYDGRWPHMHFEVYPSLAAATSYRNRIATSQLAMPAAICQDVYATSGYSTSAANLSKVSLTSDNVFRDSYQTELLALTGSAAAGYAGSFLVGVAA